MATRMLRQGIWNSEKFNCLPSDTVRLCFLRLISEQDDLGNLEGNIFGLFRLWRDFDGITSIDKATLVLEQLIEKDLVRMYKGKEDDSSEEKDYIHILNHRQRVRYFKKLYPISPFQLDEELNKINNLKEKKTGVRPTQGILKTGLSYIDIDIDKDIDIDNISLAKAKHLVKSDDVVEILTFLNQKSGRNFPIYKPNGKQTKNYELVRQLLKDGYSKDDIKSVIAKKNREWSTQQNMSMYIRPQTLFSKSKFEQYLGELSEVSK